MQPRYAQRMKSDALNERRRERHFPIPPQSGRAAAIRATTSSGTNWGYHRFCSPAFYAIAFCSSFVYSHFNNLQRRPAYFVPALSFHTHARPFAVGSWKRDGPLQAGRPTPEETGPRKRRKALGIVSAATQARPASALFYFASPAECGGRWQSTRGL